VTKFGGWSKFGGLSQFGGGLGWWYRTYRVLKTLGPAGLRPDDDDALMNRLTRADAALLAHGKVHAYRLFAELFPHKCSETLADWEEQLDSVPAVGASVTDRRNALLAIWRGNQGTSLPELRKILYPLLLPTTAFFDDFSDTNVSSRWTETGNGSSTETGTVVQLTATSGVDCRLDGTNDNGQVIRRRVHDIGDDFTVTGLVTAYSIPVADGHCGILLFQDFDNMVLLSFNGAGVSGYLQVDKIEDGTLTENTGSLRVDPAPSLPQYLQIEKVGVDLFFRYGSDDSALTEMGSIPIPFAVTRDFGCFARNDAVNQIQISFDEMKLVHATAENNVEIHEVLEADQTAAGAADSSNIFFGFIHRMPTDAGVYNILAAQRLLDRVKQGHTVLLVGESDEFLCDTATDLCDRDVLGQ
jgi:hypothetical protein